MSYEKAMKHHRNIRKCKKQSKKMYMGFDVSSGASKTSPEVREMQVQIMEVNRWFKERHDGDSQYNRGCIRESVARLRELREIRIVAAKAASVSPASIFN